MKERHSYYKADIAGVALKPQESRVIAAWMLGKNGPVNEETWQELIYQKNEVQIRGRSTLRRQSNLIRARLRLMSPDMLELITEGSFRETVHGCLAACIKHSALLGDFLDIYVRRELAALNVEIGPYHWRCFLDECRQRDPSMKEWTQSTSQRIKTSVFGILRDTDVLRKAGEWRIERVVYEERVIRQLESDDEKYCLRCMRYDR